MFSVRFSAHFGTSYHGPPHPFKDAGVVAASLIFTTNTSGQSRILVVSSTVDTRNSSALMCGQEFLVIVL
jgi:hypothetical protein